jgi:hemin uptake protein HemP
MSLRPSNPVATGGQALGETPSGETLIDSGELLAGKTELAIAHRGALYRLRITGTGKLLLTK